VPRDQRDGSLRPYSRLSRPGEKIIIIIIASKYSQLLMKLITIMKKLSRLQCFGNSVQLSVINIITNLYKFTVT
jgi:hypothetical protein